MKKKIIKYLNQEIKEFKKSISFNNNVSLNKYKNYSMLSFFLCMSLSMTLFHFGGNSPLIIINLFLGLVLSQLIYIFGAFLYKTSKKFQNSFNIFNEKLNQFNERKIGNILVNTSRFYKNLLIYFIATIMLVGIMGAYFFAESSWGLLLFIGSIFIVRLLYLEKILNSQVLFKNEHSPQHFSIPFYFIFDFMLIVFFYYIDNNINGHFIDLILGNKEISLFIFSIFLIFVFVFLFNKKISDSYLSELSNNIGSMFESFISFFWIYLLMVINLILISINLQEYFYKIFIIKEILLIIYFYFLMIKSYDKIHKLSNNLGNLEKVESKICGVLSNVEKHNFKLFSFDKHSIKYYKLEKKLYLDNCIRNPFLIYTKNFLPKEELIIYGLKFENDVSLNDNIQTYNVIIPILIKLKEPSKLRRILPNEI